ncbi:MAG: hypothetical protein ABSA83_17975 [Verrucomicrobiota bacterium]|jgi:hypothetical protein
MSQILFAALRLSVFALKSARLIEWIRFSFYPISEMDWQRWRLCSLDLTGLDYETAANEQIGGFHSHRVDGGNRGDHCFWAVIGADASGLSHGQGNDVAIQTNTKAVPICWSLKMHSEGKSPGAGNTMLGDGSVQQCNGAGYPLNSLTNPTTNWPVGHVPSFPAIRVLFP